MQPGRAGLDALSPAHCLQTSQPWPFCCTMQSDEVCVAWALLDLSTLPTLHAARSLRVPLRGGPLALRWTLQQCAVAAAAQAAQLQGRQVGAGLLPCSLCSTASHHSALASWRLRFRLSVPLHHWLCSPPRPSALSRLPCRFCSNLCQPSTRLRRCCRAWRWRLPPRHGWSASTASCWLKRWARQR